MSKRHGLTSAFLLFLCSLASACSLHPDTFQLATAPAPKSRVYPLRVAVVTDKKLAPYKIHFRYWSTTPYALSLGGLPEAYAETLIPHFLSVENLDAKRAPSMTSHDLIARMSVEKFDFDGANVQSGEDKVDVTVRFTIQQVGGRELFAATVTGSASGRSLQDCMACLPKPEPTIRKAFGEAFAQLASQLTAANIQFDGEPQMIERLAVPPSQSGEEGPTTDIAVLRARAESGDGEAQSNLGWSYYNGTGVVQDPVEAVNWYRRAAAQENASGQNRLGVAYHYGKGVARDVPRALELYRKAAAKGLVEAQLNLARTYNFGIGVKRNYGEAVIWYGKAARQGDPGAQADLGVAYANGEGVAVDDVEAARWFHKASQQGHAVATFRLASMIWGNGYSYSFVTGDRTSAHFSLFEKAAEQGYAPAAFRLAEIYSRGSGDKPPDAQQACEWAMVARSLDERNEWQDRQPEETGEVHRELPTLIARIRGQLTAEQINVCEGHAREWMTAHVK